MIGLLPFVLGAVVAALPAWPQGPAAARPQAPQPQAPAPQGRPNPAPAATGAAAQPLPVTTVQFDQNGWPVVHQDEPESAPPPAPAAEVRTPAPAGPAAVPAAARPSSRRDAPALASGLAAGSPLVEVFQACGSPGAFQALGGVVVFWRLTVHGEQGEVIGRRDLTHTADCARADRDRLEFDDGRVYGRAGLEVYAERHGMPWQTLVEPAGQELALFGLHLRLPFAFAAASDYAVVAREPVEQGGQQLWRVVLEKRPAGGLDPVGPEAQPLPRDRFEMVYAPGGGLPVELVHRLACSQQPRRVRLEDWREVSGVRLPFRRLYLDDQQRVRTTLEILRVEAVQVAERNFRLQ